MDRSLDKLTCWLPKEWSHDSPPFVLSADHRGDMYHIRAAMSALKHIDPKKTRALILYECSEENRDLQDYLLEASNLSLQTPLSLDVLRKGNPQPGDLTYKIQGVRKDVVELKQNTFERRCESDATYLVVQSVKAVANDQHKRANLLQAIRSGMIYFDAASSAKIDGLKSAFEAVSKNLFGGLNLGGRHAVLVMHRDSGSLGGAYPELDTGDALQQMLKVIASVPGPATSCAPVICGLEAGTCNGNPTVGRYWEQLKDLGKDKGISKRAVEAAFLQDVHGRNLFKLAVGFRSGALDLFTFLGIPTVSVGLNWMVGEGRHLSLANETFKRWNVQYEQPRHPATALIPDKNNANEARWNSPVLGTAPKAAEARPAAAAAKAEVIQGPGRFSEFDQRIFEIAIRISVREYIPDFEQTLYRRSSDDTFMRSRAITAKHARIFPPEALPGGRDEMLRYRDKLMEQEEADLANRRKTQKLHGEGADDIAKLENSFKSGWEESRKVWDDAAQKAQNKLEFDETGFTTVVGKGKKR